MIAMYEMGILKRYIQSTSTHERHKAKLYCMLDWIYRWGFTSPAVIAELWGLDKSGVNRMLRRYTREDVIAEVPVYSCRDKRVFILKPAGLKLIEELHQSKLKYSIKRSSFPLKTLNHDLMIQYIVAKGVREGRFHFFINEKEQGKDGTGKKRRFDAIVYDGEQMLGLEMECSSKTIPHRLDIVRRYQMAITDDNKVNKVLIFSHKRKYIKDTERIHYKLFDDAVNRLDRTFFDEHIKYVYNKQLIAELYEHFWAF